MKPSILPLAFGSMLAMPSLAAPADAPIVTPAERQSIRSRDATAAELVRLISSQLPRGATSWRVSYLPQMNPMDDFVDVRSSESVLVTLGPGINASSFDERKPTRTNPGFGFRVQPFVSPADYLRFKAENAEIIKHLAQMRTEMKGFSRKFDSYRPRDAAEKQRVDEYERVKSTLHSLPKFYFRDISLSWILPYDNEGNTSYIWRHSPGSLNQKQWDGLAQWERQQEQIARATLKLLTRYQPVAP